MFRENRLSLVQRAAQSNIYSLQSRLQARLGHGRSMQFKRILLPATKLVPHTAVDISFQQRTLAKSMPLSPNGKYEKMMI